jgi:hypothetical protein
MTHKPLFFLLIGDPKGTRTPVAGVRGQCPRPLDDGAFIVPHVIQDRGFVVKILFFIQ